MHPRLNGLHVQIMALRNIIAKTLEDEEYIRPSQDHIRTVQDLQSEFKSLCDSSELQEKHCFVHPVTCVWSCVWSCGWSCVWSCDGLDYNTACCYFLVLFLLIKMDCLIRSCDP